MSKFVEFFANNTQTFINKDHIISVTMQSENGVHKVVTHFTNGIVTTEFKNAPDAKAEAERIVFDRKVQL